MFKPGDEVICIDSKPMHPARTTHLKLGKVYVVKDTGTRTCCSIRLVDVGAKQIADYAHTQYFCTCGSQVLPNPWSAEWRFIKLDKLTEEQEEVVRHEWKYNSHTNKWLHS